MPDIKPQVYRDPRPAAYFTRFHRRARSREPDWIYALARFVLTLPTLLLFRTRQIGVDNVPRQGPAILAPNHFSAWDHFFAGVFLRRPVRFMAKSQLFRNPVIEFIFFHGGVFPVRRGDRDEEAFVTARTILARGGLVLIYIEGGRSRTRELGEARPGVGRLALETGVPVIPVAIHGSAGVRRWNDCAFPRSRFSSAPRSPMGSRRAPAASATSRSPTRSSRGCGRCTAGWSTRGAARRSAHTVTRSGRPAWRRPRGRARG